MRDAKLQKELILNIDKPTNMTIPSDGRLGFHGKGHFEMFVLWSKLKEQGQIVRQILETNST